MHPALGLLTVSNCVSNGYLSEDRDRPECCKIFQKPRHDCIIIHLVLLI